MLFSFRRPVAAAASIGVLAFLLVCTTMPTTVAAGYPGTNGRLVWSSDRGSGSGVNLFTSDLSGSNVTQITFGGTVDLDAVWSPGGQRIAFTRYTDGSGQDGDIYVIDADGSDLVRLTKSSGDDYRPTWSPDAARIAFSSNRAAGNYDIYTMADDGSDLHRVTTHSTIQAEPAWSPQDLNRMLISTYQRSSGPAATSAIAEIDVRTGEVTTFWTNPGTNFDQYPDWKPTGNGMTWMRTDCSTTSCVDIDVWVSNFASFRSAIVGEPNAFAEHPGWAPDSERIYYSTDINDPDPTDDNVIFDVWNTLPNGTDQNPVTDNSSSFSFAVDVQPIPAFPLVDARFSSFQEEIEWIFGEGITSGCNAERYCPNNGVTRGQMAAFLTRALDLPAATADYFTDDEGSTFEDSINRVREAEIAFGCTATTYCPTQVVTRGQMAAFLARALDLPPATQDYFTDDELSSFEESINQVSDADIAFGCTSTRYCPSNPVTRGQMAAFLFRALAP